MIYIVNIDGLWNIEYNGIIIDTFVFYSEAEDAAILLKYELDHAWDDIGSEFDGVIDSVLVD
jgi:hypothetical protein